MVFSPKYLDVKVVHGKAGLFILEDGHNLLWAYVVNVEVENGFRRIGIGKELMNKCEIVALSYGCKHINLQTRFSNLEARLFYQSLDYYEGVAFGKELKEVEK